MHKTEVTQEGRYPSKTTWAFSSAYSGGAGWMPPVIPASPREHPKASLIIEMRNSANFTRLRGELNERIHIGLSVQTLAVGPLMDWNLVIPRVRERKRLISPGLRGKPREPCSWARAAACRHQVPSRVGEVTVRFLERVFEARARK